ncbi:MAG: monovalent cation/H(+) antiporter subunit G [Calditrichaeota bacterium]|mgnify:FL=1|nr:monovalent cation/H(+) antiporter subunit G [Calditrichota bacterium]MBT7616079.1 monovalent cation/H(+) antiporter subunit G [Calditrichota bacterium]MBT7788229.1 monovalent cation/H(+) antiporter subunit G [Calditrichota bacterium]
MLIDIICIGLMSLGLFFFFATTIGILRLPDFYSRMQAAGKGDTLSSMLVLTGLAVYNLHHWSFGTLLVSVKIMFILVFIFMASPTASHHIIEAGYDAGVKPWTKGEEKNEQEGKEN